MKGFDPSNVDETVYYNEDESQTCQYTQIKVIDIRGYLISMEPEKKVNYSMKCYFGNPRTFCLSNGVY